MLKLGYGFQQDLKILRSSFPTIQAFSRVAPIIDLDRFVKRALIAPSENINGLKRLVSYCSGGNIMNKLQQCSPWAQRPLSAAQIEYAALDAHVLISTFAQLQEKCARDDFLAAAAEYTTAYVALAQPTPARPCESDSAACMEHFMAHEAIEINASSVAAIAEQRGVKGVLAKRCDISSDAIFVKTLAILARQKDAKDPDKRVMVPCVVLMDETLRVDMRSFSKMVVGRSRKSAMAFPSQLVPLFGVLNCVAKGPRFQGLPCAGYKPPVQVFIDDRLASSSKLACATGTRDELIVLPGIESLQALSDAKIMRIPAENNGRRDDDSTTRERSESESAVKFLADTSLSRLARWLRMLGVDTEIFQPQTALKKQLGVADMLKLAQDEDRIVLTGRKDLESRCADVPIMVLQSRNVYEQFENVTKHFGIPLQAEASLRKSAMMGRCSKCNGDEIVVVSVDRVRDAVARGEVPQKLLDDAKIDEFWECNKCNQVYWEGERFRLTKSSFLEAYKDIRSRSNDDAI